jgi:micrococcal nuclease
MRRRPSSLLVLLAAAVAAALAAAGWSRDRSDGAGGGAGSSQLARVERVVDGDTIVVRLERGGARERVRYIGVDTPESVKPDTPVQCYAKAAARENARLVAGRRVRLIRDVEERDRFGRLLAYVVRVDDGRSVNAALVRGGFAQPLTIPPNVRNAERYRALAAQARRARRGLWGACAG